MTPRSGPLVLGGLVLLGMVGLGLTTALGSEVSLSFRAYSSIEGPGIGSVPVSPWIAGAGLVLAGTLLAVFVARSRR